MNVVRIVQKGVRVLEDPRQLTRGQLARGLSGYEGEALTLGLASRDRGRRCKSERELAKPDTCILAPSSFREDGDRTPPPAPESSRYTGFIRRLSGKAAARRVKFNLRHEPTARKRPVDFGSIVVDAPIPHAIVGIAAEPIGFAIAVLLDTE